MTYNVGDMVRRKSGTSVTEGLTAIIERPTHMGAGVIVTQTGLREWWSTDSFELAPPSPEQIWEAIVGLLELRARL